MINVKSTFMDGERYHLTPLSTENITVAKKLCDISVGQNLYTIEVLNRAIKTRNHLFYLLYEETREIGHFYCFVTDVPHATKQLKLDSIPQQLFKNEQAKVGLFQSIGFLPEYQKNGLAIKMIHYFEKILFDQYKVNIIVVPSWKQGGFIPAEKPLLKSGFTYFADVHRAWHEVKELKCPYCRNNKCICDSAIFYKAGE